MKYLWCSTGVPGITYAPILFLYYLLFLLEKQNREPSKLYNHSDFCIQELNLVSL